MMVFIYQILAHLQDPLAELFREVVSGPHGLFVRVTEPANLGLDTASGRIRLGHDYPVGVEKSESRVSDARRHSRLCVGQCNPWQVWLQYKRRRHPSHMRLAGRPQ